jgi:hypothetical protein
MMKAFNSVTKIYMVCKGSKPHRAIRAPSNQIDFLLNNHSQSATIHNRDAALLNQEFLLRLLAFERFLVRDIIFLSILKRYLCHALG